MNWNFFITAYFNSVFGALIAPMYVRYLHKTGKLDDRFHNLLLLFFLTFSFWSYHFLFALGVNSSLPPWKHLFLILLAVTEAYGTKKYIRRLFTIQTFHTGLFLRKGSLAAVYFVAFEILYHLLIFDRESQLSLNLSAFVLTISLSLGISFSALRLLILLSRESSEPRYRNWLYAGAFFIGVALTINPLLITISMIDPQAADLPLNFNFSLIPFSLQAACWVALLLVPDTYGEKIRLREIEKREETERYYHSLFRHNPDGVLALNREGLILQANTSSAGMSGYEEAELVGQSLSALLPGVCLTLPEDVHAATLLQDDTYETWLRKKSGAAFSVRVTTIPIIMDNKVAGMYAVVKDIEDAKAYQNRIHHLAYHDELTGLPNRRYFMNELAARAAEALTGFAVIYVDLDRFKKVNDLFGHSFGDQLITDAASKLRQLLPKSSILARLGGDEFVILADGTADKMLLQPLLRKIVGLFGQPLLVMGQEVILSASLGVAFFPKDGTEPDELMKKADLAMYESKRNGAQHFHFYENTMKAADLADILLENDLRRALERGEMEAYYQPKVDHSTSAVIGGEALLRWRHPRLGLVSPARFIPVAEETGVIVELERWIMEEACRQNKRWQEEGLPAIPISVNLSPSHLSQSTIITTVTEALGKSGLEARYLELEVTESMMMHNEERSILRLHQFKLLGLSISMDDFGTGYSSLSYLTKLPIDILKIDQSFVRQLETGSRAIVETIISMARLLSLQVIAEGVETLEQAELLASLGCVQVQGYCYSPPVPAAEFRQLLEQQAVPPSAGFQSSCL